jgi:uncharacterized protein
MNILIYGFIAGILFGFLLQRGQVLRYEKQLGALRLLDMTIVKFMLSSILWPWWVSTSSTIWAWPGFP